MTKTKDMDWCEGQGLRRRTRTGVEGQGQSRSTWTGVEVQGLSRKTRTKYNGKDKVEGHGLVSKNKD